MALFRIIHVSDLHLCIRPNRRNFFKIAYDRISDLPVLTLRHLSSGQHLGFFPSSYSDEIAELAARQIYDFDEEFDVIVASGDLATIGTKPSIDAAHDFITSGYSYEYLGDKLQPTLGGDPKRIFLVPGNHDRYRNLIGGTGAKEFDRAFQGYWASPKLVTSMALRKGNERIYLVAGDFCLQSDDDAYGFNRLGRGKAYQRVVDEMVTETERLREQMGTGVVIWVSHFPPIPFEDLRLLLIDHALLEGAAIQHRINFFMSGHLHRNQITQTQYGTPIVCAGSLCSCDENGNNWIHVIDLEVDGGVLKSSEKADYHWNDTDQEFSRTLTTPF